mgnify:CR=1 FL=1
MKLYKFRSLRDLIGGESVDLNRTLEILRTEQLYCAPHNKLNDPFEGLFSTVETIGGAYGSGAVTPTIKLSKWKMPKINLEFSQLMTSYKGSTTEIRHTSLGELSSSNKNQNVCSLSSSMSDVRMWSHYADSHMGCVIEIDLEEDELDLYKVIYGKDINRYSKTKFEEINIFDVLTFKTCHWEYEKEFRIITGKKHFSISGCISGVHLGIRTPDEVRDDIVGEFSNRYPIMQSQINRETVEIQRGACLGKYKGDYA